MLLAVLVPIRFNTVTVDEFFDSSGQNVGNWSVMGVVEGVSLYQDLDGTRFKLKSETGKTLNVVYQKSMKAKIAEETWVIVKGRYTVEQYFMAEQVTKVDKRRLNN